MVRNSGVSGEIPNSGVSPWLPNSGWQLGGIGQRQHLGGVSA